VYYLDSPQELEYLEMTNRLGNANNLMMTGTIYYFGLRGERPDYAKAFKYYEIAAAKGDIQAKVNMGIMMIYGTGIPKDLRKGLEIMQEASVKGDARAKNVLGKNFKVTTKI
jgi:TPR repeat protein